MFFVSDIYTTPPDKFDTPLQKEAYRVATTQGIDTIITNGKYPSALYEIIRGGNVGTLFVGKHL